MLHFEWHAQSSLSWTEKCLSFNLNLLWSLRTHLITPRYLKKAICAMNPVWMVIKCENGEAISTSDGAVNQATDAYIERAEHSAIKGEGK